MAGEDTTLTKIFSTYEQALRTRILVEKEQNPDFNKIVGNILGITKKYITSQHPAVNGLSFILVKMLSVIKDLGYKDLIVDLYQKLDQKGAMAGPLIVAEIPQELFCIWNPCKNYIGKKNKTKKYEILSNDSAFQVQCILLFKYIIADDEEKARLLRYYNSEFDKLFSELQAFKNIGDIACDDRIDQTKIDINKIEAEEKGSKGSKSSKGSKGSKGSKDSKGSEKQKQSIGSEESEGSDDDMSIDMDEELDLTIKCPTEKENSEHSEQLE